MNSATVHNVSRIVNFNCLQRRNKMSTTSYEPNEAYLPAAGVPRKQRPTNSGSRAGNLLGSQPLSRSSVHHGYCVCGRSEDSDDDLITAAQRGDQQAFVELCARHSPLAKKKKILSDRSECRGRGRRTSRTLSLRAYTHLNSFRRVCKFSTWLTTIGMNSALMILRKRRVRREAYLSGSSPDTEREELPEPVDGSLRPEGIYLKQQDILLVRREVKKLKSSLRSVVCHYYGSGNARWKRRRKRKRSLWAQQSLVCCEGESGCVLRLRDMESPSPAIEFDRRSDAPPQSSKCTVEDGLLPASNNAGISRSVGSNRG